MTELQDRTDIWADVDAIALVAPSDAKTQSRRRWLLAGALVTTFVVAVIVLIALGPFADAAGGCGGG